MSEATTARQWAVHSLDQSLEASNGSDETSYLIRAMVWAALDVADAIRELRPEPSSFGLDGSSFFLSNDAGEGGT
jgi:hypothetical protein